MSAVANKALIQQLWEGFNNRILDVFIDLVRWTQLSRQKSDEK
jgi:hypothetical protein